METFWRAFYNLFVIPLLYLAFRFIALFDAKVARGLKVRKGVFESLKSQLSSKVSKPYTIWFHCSSWEFEQAKTLIPKLKGQSRIVVSFFSPSGFESARNYPYIDATFYLPLDTPKNARRLIELINPSLLVFVKFDIWPNLIWQAKRGKIPVALVAGSLHSKSKRLWPIAKSFFKSFHQYIPLHCAISELDAKRFREIALETSKIVVAGDTRYDQVYQRSISFQADEILIPGQKSLQGKSIVAGSTHFEDESVLLKSFGKLRRSENGLKLILVPHETDCKRLSQVEGLLTNFELRYLRLSEVASASDLDKAEVVLVDRVGMLAKLYRLGFLAFVGGSFYGKIHNVMEPAALCKPVIFGPYIHNSHEALQLLQIGAAIAVKNAHEMTALIQKLIDSPQMCHEMGTLGKSLIEENLGATDRTLSYLKDLYQK